MNGWKGSTYSRKKDRTTTACFEEREYRCIKHLLWKQTKSYSKTKHYTPQRATPFTDLKVDTLGSQHPSHISHTFQKKLCHISFSPKKKKKTKTKQLHSTLIYLAHCFFHS